MSVLCPTLDHMSHLLLSWSCCVLMSFSLGCPLWTSCRPIWFTTATREAWLFISGSRLSNLPGRAAGERGGAYLSRTSHLSWTYLSCTSYLGWTYQSQTHLSHTSYLSHTSHLSHTSYPSRTHLCWTTSRSSMFSGIWVPVSHCSFSWIQRWQAWASPSIR